MKKEKTILLLAVTLALIGFISQSALAVLINLDFSSLPSSQGWSFNNDGRGTPESVFTAGGTLLTMNTIGYEGKSARYELSSGIDFNKPFSVSMTAKVLDYNYGSWPGNDFGFAFGVFLESGLYAFGLSENYIETVVGVDYAHTNTVSSTYLLNIDPVTNQYELLINNTPFLQGSAHNSSMTTSYIFLGDSTNGPTANAEITAFSISQIPEPATLLLLGLGGLVLRRHKA